MITNSESMLGPYLQIAESTQTMFLLFILRIIQNIQTFHKENNKNKRRPT